MKIVCERCGRKIEVKRIEDARGWYAPSWLGYIIKENEVMKVGICPKCLDV